MTTQSKTGKGDQAHANRAGDIARKAGERAVGSVDAYPVAALVGGLAIGAVLGALLPKTRQEEELLGPIGGAINERARNAASAARDAAQAKADEVGLSKDAAGKQAGRLIESIVQVAETASSAAVNAARN